MDLETERQRFLIEMERQMRILNHDVLDPEIKELTLEDLTPAIKLVAKARANYLKAYVAIAEEHPDSLPTSEEIKGLRTARVVYDELLHANQALEIAISRGYLTIKREQ